MKNNETCNALKCVKPSGLINWINCSLCNGWVHIKCSNISRTEARSFAEFKCIRCSLVNTIPQCQDVNFRPDTLFNSGVVHLKSVPKRSRIPLAENLMPKISDNCRNTVKFCLVVLTALPSELFFEKTTTTRETSEIIPQCNYQ